MSTLMKVAITLTLCLFILYGYIIAEEKSPEANPVWTDIMRVAFLVLTVTDFIVLMFCLWR